MNVGVKAVAASLTMAVLACGSLTARADDPLNPSPWLSVLAAEGEPAGNPPSTAPAGGGAAATEPAADKSAYNLFRPTPANLMRPMDLDRPNVTNTPHTIDAGHVQVETGVADFTHLHDRSAGGDTRTDTWGLGQFNVRAGILDNLEFNVAVTSFGFLDSHDYLTGQSTRASEFGDTVVGGKLNLWGNEMGETVWATALGVQPQVKLPTAGRGLGTGRVEGQLNIPFLMNLPADFHLGLMTSPLLERNSSNTGYCAGWINSISVDRVLFDRYDFFVECVSHVTDEGGQEGQGTVDLGVIYSLTPNVALDTAVNLGANRASPAVEWTAGVSFRF